MFGNTQLVVGFTLQNQSVLGTTGYAQAAANAQRGIVFHFALVFRILLVGAHGATGDANTALYAFLRIFYTFVVAPAAKGLFARLRSAAN